LEKKIKNGKNGQNEKKESGKTHFFLLFPIAKELHHMHKAMGKVILHHGISNTTN